MADSARSDSPAVQAQLDRLTMLSPGRDVLGLERISALMKRLGSPHRSLPPVFHVAGTNGKGSTCAFLRSILEAAGKRVHVYTSPHLVRFNERIRLAGTLIDDDLLAPLLAEVLDCSEDIHPSFFEATTAAAFLAFSRQPADAAVIEVGLGGRLDATNVIEAPVVCGIAQIGIDHQSFLGETLAEIAAEKAGIAKPGVPVVSLAQRREVERVIEDSVQRAGATLLLEGRDWTPVAVAPAMFGRFQLRNGALAAEMVRVVAFADESAIAAGMTVAHWPGRLQKLGAGLLTRRREVWIDGAHNAAAAQVLAEELAANPKHVILGILANKDAQGILAALAPHVLSLTFVDVPGHESHDPAALAAQYNGIAAASIEDALSALPEHEPVLIAGSLYLAGEILQANGEAPK